MSTTPRTDALWVDFRTNYPSATPSLQLSVFADMKLREFERESEQRARALETLLRAVDYRAWLCSRTDQVAAVVTIEMLDAGYAALGKWNKT